MWQAISYIGTGLSLVAFLAASAVWIYRNKVKQTENLIKSAPSKDRGKLVEHWLEVFKIDPINLTKDQQYNLALIQIKNKAKRFYTTALIIVSIALVFLIITALAITKSKDELPNSSKNLGGYNYKIDESVLIFDFTHHKIDSLNLKQDSTVMNRFDLVEKTDDTDDDYIIRSGTNGDKQIGQSITHGNSADFKELEKGALTSLSLKHVYELRIPTEKFPVNEKTTVHSIYTYINAFKGLDSEWLGNQTKYFTKRLTIVAKFPSYKTCKKIKAFYMLAGMEKLQPFKGAQPFLSQDGQTLLWAIEPGLGASYAIKFWW